MKKKIWTATVAIMLCSLIAAGSTVAYFSYATTPIVNVITTGEARIELIEEEHWGEGPQSLNPGNKVSKSPAIANTGSVEVYVRIRMTLDSTTAALLKNGSLSFLGVNSTDWAGFPSSFDKTQPDQGITIVATLREPLAAGKTSFPLFTGVALGKRYVENTSSQLNITLVAEAVQTIEGKTAAECWAML